MCDAVLEIGVTASSSVDQQLAEQLSLAQQQLQQMPQTPSRVPMTEDNEDHGHSWVVVDGVPDSIADELRDHDDWCLIPRADSIASSRGTDLDYL